MLITIAQAACGLVMLYYGGEWLVRGASALASRIGISPLAVGLTVVAFGTSAPELIVSVDAALSGVGDISLGNIVGSNIANIALILGLAAAIRPIAVHAKVVRVDAPLMLAVSVALLAILANAHVSRLEGALLLVGLACYIALTFWESRRESIVVQEELASAAPHVVSRTFVGPVLLVVGLLVLVVGGHLLVTAAVKLATLLGVSQAAIGLTIVAVGTSLPELATSVVASARGQGDIAVGNVVGSNIFNILGILGVTVLVRPLGLGAITWLDLGTMVFLAAALAILIFTRHRLDRIEGLLLLAAFVAYTGWLLAA